jgi:ATP-dependent Clp protease ATP-binding subunit ClpA
MNFAADGQSRIDETAFEAASEPFGLPDELAPSDDLTARAEQAEPMTHFPFADEPRYERLFDALCRALHRRSGRHVLLVGERGVGKSTIVAELARRAASGQIGFLRDKRMVWIDGRYAPPAERLPRLAAILAHLASRPDLVACVEGLATLLRGEHGQDYRLFLVSILAKAPFQLVALVTPHEYEELTSDSPEMLEFFSRVDVEEPEMVVALKLLRHYALGLEASYSVRITDEAVRQAALLSANYLLNDQLPAKAIKVLARCCEDLDYERQRAEDRASAGMPAGEGAAEEQSNREVTADAVVAEVSRASGVPQETLRGIAERGDYEQSLSQYIIGQPDAVRAVATELSLIKAGMTDPGKPASVMLFVGQTGTGKTEMAKALARFYSTSKRLQVYTLGNFVEPHSVAGIIGVPPGYVGHNLGGRLVNELAADPYCVFLLDEADKAHPDVLQPFLNLFDEGWVRDQRGVKAYGDKAIFILTTNVAQKMIADLARSGEPAEAIAEKCKASLSQIRHQHANRPVFSPEFLARIKRVIVFQPLDRGAMEGIGRNLVRELKGVWGTKREKSLEVPEELVAYLAEEADRRNYQSAGKEGGRLMRKLLTDWVEAKVQKAITEDPQRYRQCQVVEVEWLAPLPAAEGQEAGKPEVRIHFRSEKAADEGASTLAQAAAMATAAAMAEEEVSR